MGGLGNGRRGGRSPPLMIGALIACVLVLGFNYWVSSSRNLDLQTKLYELEGQVRRGVAERSETEMKRKEDQKEILRQKEQINHLESISKRQLEGAQNTYSQEKRTLQQNISSSTKTIQELSGQLNQLNDDLGKLQNELQSCHNSINTLNNKLTYDMTHCKELCDERVAAAKLEVQKKMEKLVPSQHVSPQENAAGGAVKEDRPVMTAADATVVSHALSLSEPKGNEQPELLTNEINVGKGPDSTVLSSHKDQPKVEPAPSAAAVKQDILPPPEGAVKTQDGEAETSKPLKNNLTEEKEVEVMGPQGETQTEDPGMEGMLIGQGNADETAIGQKMDEPDEYDADEQVVGGADLEKQQQSKAAENIGVEEELADYNGDDENEGEFEADKQIELAQH